MRRSIFLLPTALPLAVYLLFAGHSPCFPNNGVHQLYHVQQNVCANNVMDEKFPCSVKN